MTKVLVVVDMQEDFVNGSLGSQRAKDIIPAVKAKIEEYSSSGGTIIFTQDTHFDDYLQTLEGRNLPVVHCIEGTDGWQLESQISPANPEAVVCVPKNTFGYSEWNYTLTSILGGSVEDRVVSIELVGLCSSICVLANAVIFRALYPNLNIIVDAAACGCVSDVTHNTAMKCLQLQQVEVINWNEEQLDWSGVSAYV